MSLQDSETIVSPIPKEEEHCKVIKKVEKLQEKYQKFEKGEINGEEFRDFIVNDIGVQPSEKIEKILKAPQPDGKNFTNILTSLDLLKKKETLKNKDKRNVDYSAKHMRYKRVLTVPKENDEDDPWSGLESQAKKLLKRVITGEDFRTELRNQGINPMIEAINKVIRDHETGKFVKFNELLGTIIKNKNSKFDPTKINIEVKSKKFYDEATGEEDPVIKKKTCNTKYSSFTSNKDLFDWDLSTVQKFKSGELTAKVPNKEDKNIQMVFESKVFDNTPQFDSPLRGKTSSEKLSGSGNIFTWKGAISDSKSNNDSIKRRNPNQTFVPDADPEKKPVKLNKMLFSSQENVLNDLKGR